MPTHDGNIEWVTLKEFSLPCNNEVTTTWCLAHEYIHLLGYIERVDGAIVNDSHDVGVSTLGIPGHPLEEVGWGYGISYIVRVDAIICKGTSDAFPSDLVVPFVVEDVNTERMR